MKASHVLRKLVRGCVDDERTLRRECKFVDASRTEALTRLAREREQFVVDLERLGKFVQPHDGSWAERWREWGRSLWVTAAGRNNGDAIAECRRSRARTEALYDQALQTSQPNDITRVLAAQRRQISDETDELTMLQF
jgi:hypothetical protein